MEVLRLGSRFSVGVWAIGLTAKCVTIRALYNRDLLADRYIPSFGLSR